MGGIVVKVEHNFDQVARRLKGIPENVVKKAVARSMNRTIVGVQKEAVKIAKKTLNLPAGGTASKGGGGLTPPGIKSMLAITKTKAARSVPISQMFVSLKASQKPISLIHFVTGNKYPEGAQQGLPVSARKKVVIKITKGRKEKLNHAFIARAKGAVNVFIRKGRAALSIVKKSVPSLWVWLGRDKLQKDIQAVARDRYQREITSNMKYYMDLEIKKSIPPSA